MSVAVLTDSTSCLPSAMAEKHGVDVIPLHVTVGAATFAEGVDITAAEVATLLGEGKQQVSTSRPAPGEFVERYLALAAAGHTGIVSLHLPAKVSGTVEAAQLAAAEVASQIQVSVLDTGTLGMALGFAACAAGRAAADGADLDEVTALAAQRAEASWTGFYVDSLEYLRKGGRVGTAQAIIGQALAIKPLLTVADGQVQLWERVRTRARALSRLEEATRDRATASWADHGSAAIAVQHLGWEQQAQDLRERLAAALPELSVDVVELGAVTGVHTGPGTLAVAVAPGVD